jgi:beta-galactosidase/beta-glucuronidase
VPACRKAASIASLAVSRPTHPDWNAMPHESRASVAEAPACYPRPQLYRPAWTSLNGTWQFAFDRDAVWRFPRHVIWDREIVVPFSPETPASGVGDPGFTRQCWYRRTFTAPDSGGGRVFLHFGAVDHEARVWVNGALAGRHTGGYTPFSFDITELIRGDGPQEIVVRAYDDPADLEKPRGKQDWKLEPHSIWYPRTTGIWQTVWLEVVPATWIQQVRWTPSLHDWHIELNALLGGDERGDLRLRVRLSADGRMLAEDTYAVIGGEVRRAIILSDPGIDDSRNELLWNPHSPTLIEAQVELWGRRGERIDAIRSYTALRSLTTEGDRVLLNGRPLQLRMVLDQGYWIESGMTAPDTDALRRDIELTRAMGFNGVRKHQKIEDPRYLYWADRLGLLVWEEMPSAYRFTEASVRMLTQEWMAVLERDYSHPCIAAWVPFNESWGVPNLPDAPAQRHYVEALYHLTKTFDPTRPVVGNDGWESVATDIIGIHDYDPDPVRMAARYHAEVALPRLFRRERPGGRVLVIEGQPRSEHPIVLSEFGGIAVSADADNTWGYSRCPDVEAFADRYTAFMHTMRDLDLFAGFCYTQFADTYQEANGLLHADRTPKFPIGRIAAATSGPIPPPGSPLRSVPGKPSPGVEPATDV